MIGYFILPHIQGTVVVGDYVCDCAGLGHKKRNTDSDHDRDCGRRHKKRNTDSDDANDASSAGEQTTDESPEHEHIEMSQSQLKQ